MELSTGRETHAIIYGISKNELYQLRLCAYSRGGDGNLGNTVYFTLGMWKWKFITNCELYTSNVETIICVIMCILC